MSLLSLYVTTFWIAELSRNLLKLTQCSGTHFTDRQDVFNGGVKIGSLDLTSVLFCRQIEMRTFHCALTFTFSFLIILFFNS